jgi:hypothetical protein
MLTSGIDLSAEAKGTALAIIEWADSRAKVIQLELGVTDETIIAHSLESSKIGIDCALGWPIEFVDFVVEHSALNPNQIDGGIDWRRKLAYRDTDRVVREITGRWPLSVSTDRLGLTAMRCAGLLSKMQQSAINTDRSGAGTVVEIYPGATLRLWGFDTNTYRSSSSKRHELLGELLSQAPWLEIGSVSKMMVESCDAFDAVIASLAARSAALGFYQKPDVNQIPRARIEGWVALPSMPLSALVSAE